MSLKLPFPMHISSALSPGPPSSTQPAPQSSKQNILTQSGPQPPQKLNEQNMSCGLYLGGVVVGPGGQLDDAALAPDQRVPELVAAHTHGAHGTDARDHNLRIHKTHEPSGADSRHAEGLEFRGVASCRALRYTTKAADLFYSSTEQNGPLG